MLTVRGTYENGEIKLKEKISSRGKIPVFITFLEDMEESKAREGIFHDLDYLAGTWTEEEGREFLEVTENFNKIDEELWK
jgi:hypothetical protein